MLLRTMIRAARYASYTFEFDYERLSAQRAARAALFERRALHTLRVMLLCAHARHDARSYAMPRTMLLYFDEDVMSEAAIILCWRCCCRHFIPPLMGGRRRLPFIDA